MTDEIRTKVVLTIASARPIPLDRAQAWIHNASFHGISLHEDGIAQPGDPRPDQDGWEYVKILNVELGDDGLSNPVGTCPECDSDDLQWQAGDDDRVLCTDCDWHGWPEELKHPDESFDADGNALAHGRCDTCGAPCDERGCTVDLAHVVAIEAS